MEKFNFSNQGQTGNAQCNDNAQHEKSILIFIMAFERGK